ncbi:DnaB-like helicase C-terminal domain-containing protein [uncultured Clostridium sp.]|uniref:replicative DNA helicase n=1 Tax=uncultured Clostridium sp. TaxID=59620 RepID=UPI0025E34C85|nr:DnaB-like helicase C-terminal domain-containing protein [uncultured Clostridium sp.]
MDENIEILLESERCVLGIIIRHNEYLLKAMEAITEEDFYRTTHKILYCKMVGLYKKDIKFDLIVLLNSLKKSISENVVTVTEITEIASSYITRYTFDSHLKIILEHSMRRKINDICNNVLNSEESIEKKITYIQNSLMKITSHNGDDRYLTIDDVIENTLKRIEEASKSKDGITGIPTGVKILDNAINGFERGSMVVFGARPSIGKTAFSLKILENIKAKVLYVQLDMTLEGMGQRMLSSDTHISNNRIGKGRLSDEHFEKIIKSAAILEKKNNLFFYAPGVATISKIMLKAKEIKIKHGLDVIIIDHIGKISSKISKPYERMTAISNNLKSMARQLDVCMVALCQLSRVVEQRGDKHPILSDLRDSGAIEEDADVIGFLYRDGYYNDKSKKQDILELNIEKNRNGQTGKLEFEYNLVTQELIQILEE